MNSNQATNKFYHGVAQLYKESNLIDKHIAFKFCSINPNTNKVLILLAQPNDKQPAGSVACALLSAKNVYEAYAKAQRNQGNTPELTVSQIQSESRRHPYWIKNPTEGACKCHRLKIHPDGTTMPVWILRLDSMENSLSCAFEELLYIIKDSSGDSLHSE